MDLLEAILNLPPEKARNVLNLLDPLERQVIEILLKKKVALTAQQIIDSLVEDLAGDVLRNVGELEEEGAIHVGILEGGGERTYQIHKKSGELDLPLWENTYYPGKIYVKLSDFIRSVNEYTRKISKAKTKTEMTALKKKLVGSFCELPSFRRLEQNILPELIAAGLVVSREPVGKKRAKILYAANPALYDVLRTAPNE